MIFLLTLSNLIEENSKKKLKQFTGFVRFRHEKK